LILYPLPPDGELIGLEFYNRIHTEDQDIHVIIPTILICKKLACFNSTIFNYLVSDRLSEIFKGWSINNTGESRIGRVLYNSDFKGHQVKTIAKWLFTIDNEGLRFLKMIGSNLKEHLMNSEGSNGDYLKTEIPFNGDVNFFLEGKKFFYRNNSIFITERILSVGFDKNIFTVDSIELIPMYDKRSTESRKDKNVTEVDRNVAYNTNDELEFERGNYAGNSFHGIETEELPDDTGDDFGLDIPIKIIRREDQENAFISHNNPVWMDLEGRTIETEKVDSDSMLLRTEFDLPTPTIKRFEYLRSVANILYKDYDIRNKFFELDNRITESGVQNIDFHGKSEHFLLIELNTNSRFFYILEFNSGHTGIFHSLQLNKISNEVMILLVREFLKNEKRWSSIRNISEAFEKKFNVRILTPMEHQVKYLGSKESIERKAAKKLYDRVQFVLNHP
ncbi:MAG: hypothetical protein ABJQ84_06840, partial [Ekhidna sp.]